VGDEVLSREENDPDGPLAWKRVEERFERVGLVCELEVSGGRRIGTTAEHPFYVAGKGWTAAGELQPGDRILGLGPQEGVAVVAVRATGRWVPLYNLRIADYHTYFVGDRDWEGALWAHNSCNLHLGKDYDREVQEVGDRIANWLGQGFRIARNDERAFVAISQDGLRRFRIDFLGHGHHPKPHAHLEIFKKDVKRWIDAIPGRHFLDLQL
jgi:intein/homing endonuclease